MSYGPDGLVRFNCSGCGSKAKADPKHAGFPVKCPKCGAETMVPGTMYMEPAEVAELIGEVVQPPPVLPSQPAYLPPPPQYQPAGYVEYQTPYDQHDGYQRLPPGAYQHGPAINSGVSAVLSFLWVGLGHMYNGNVGKGIMLALIDLVLVVIAITTCLGVVPLLGFCVWGIYDAYNEAEQINRRRRGGAW